MNEPCTQAAFAELVGLSESAVSQMRAAGLLVDGASMRGWLLAYIDRLREQAAGRLGIDGQGADLVAERALLARAQREEAELRLSERRGEVISVAAIRTALAGVISATRDSLMQLPARLAPVLAAEIDAAKVHDLIQAEIHQALAALTATPTRINNPADPLGASGAAVGSTTPKD